MILNTLSPKVETNIWLLSLEILTEENPANKLSIVHPGIKSNVAALFLDIKIYFHETAAIMLPFIEQSMSDHGNNFTVSTVWNNFTVSTVSTDIVAAVNWVSVPFFTHNCPNISAAMVIEPFCADLMAFHCFSSFVISEISFTVCCFIYP